MVIDYKITAEKYLTAKLTDCVFTLWPI